MNIKIKADKNGRVKFYAMNYQTQKFHPITAYHAFRGIEHLNANVTDETPDNQPNAWWK